STHLGALRPAATSGECMPGILARRILLSTSARAAVIMRKLRSRPDSVEVEAPRDPDEASWRQRAVSRSLSAARSRAEQRVQRFLDAAFKLIDEKGTTEFTIQEVVDRSKQSLRSFYQYFDGKDELLLALFEETVRESMEDLRAVVDAETDPLT